MKLAKISLIALLLWSLVVTPAAQIQAANSTLPTLKQSSLLNPPTILPDNPLYFFKRLFENIQLTFTGDQSQKAALQVKQVHERLSEADAELAKNNVNAADRAMSDYSATASDASKTINNLLSAKQVQIDVYDLANQVQSDTQSYMNLMGTRYSKAKSKAEQKKIQDEFNKWLAQVLKSMGNIQLASGKIVNISGSAITIDTPNGQETYAIKDTTSLRDFSTSKSLLSKDVKVGQLIRVIYDSSRVPLTNPPTPHSAKVITLNLPSTLINPLSGVITDISENQVTLDTGSGPLDILLNGVSRVHDNGKIGDFVNVYAIPQKSSYLALDIFLQPALDYEFPQALVGNITNNSIEVDYYGQARFLNINKNTSITNGNSSANLSDIYKGQTVSVRYSGYPNSDRGYAYNIDIAQPTRTVLASNPTTTNVLSANSTPQPAPTYSAPPLAPANNPPVVASDNPAVPTPTPNPSASPATPTPAPTPTPTPNPGFNFVTRSGNNLQYKGSNITLKGFNFNNATATYNGLPFVQAAGTANGNFAVTNSSLFMENETDFTTVSGWGANYIDFGIDWDWWGGSDSTTTQAQLAFSVLDQRIAWAKKHNLWVVLRAYVPFGGGQTYNNSGAANQSFWTTSPSNSATCSPNAQTWYFFYKLSGHADNPSQCMNSFMQGTLDWWKMIAAHYANEPTIIAYDFINEPSTRDFHDQMVPYFDYMMDQIKPIDPNHLFFVQDVGNGTDFSGAALWTARTDTVMEQHFYAPLGFTTPNTGSPLTPLRAYPGPMPNSGSLGSDYLNVAISSSGTPSTISVANSLPSSFPSSGNFTVAIDNEIFTVNKASSTSLNVVARNVNSLGAAAHIVSAEVGIATYLTSDISTTSNATISVDSTRGFGTSINGGGAQFLVIDNEDMRYGNVTGTGTVDIANLSPTVTSHSGTQFTTQLSVGQSITVNGQSHTITAVTSSTVTTNSNFSITGNQNGTNVSFGYCCVSNSFTTANTSFTNGRGADGSTAATHSTGAVVRNEVYASKTVLYNVLGPESVSQGNANDITYKPNESGEVGSEKYNTGYTQWVADMTDLMNDATKFGVNWAYFVYREYSPTHGFGVYNGLAGCSGTISTNSGSGGLTLNGAGTKFTTELNTGDNIYIIGNQQQLTISTIDSDTQMEVSSAPNPAITAGSTNHSYKCKVPTAELSSSTTLDTTLKNNLVTAFSGATQPNNPN